MEYNQLLEELKPLTSNSAYARSESGKNEISNVIRRYLDANFSENRLANSNININLIFGGTYINDMNTQAQSQLQVEIEES